MAQRRRHMGEDGDLVPEWPVPGKFLVYRGEFGGELARRDVADPRHYFFVQSCAMSAPVTLGLIASKRPLARVSRTASRTALSASIASEVAVVMRRTPSASSAATVGWPARTLMLIGHFSASTSRLIVGSSRSPIG